MPSGNPNIAKYGENTRWKPGQVTNPKGVPKGTKHINTWVQEILEDEDFEAWINDPKEGVIKFKGAPIKAILKAQLNMAINSRDEQTRIKATDLLMKYGWSKKIEQENTGEQKLIIETRRFNADQDN